MHALPLPVTPTLAASLGIVLRDLAALIARRFLSHPLHAILIIPLCRHIARTTLRLENLLARLAAGPLPPPKPRAHHHSGPRRQSPFPAAHAWLLRALGHEAAGYASQLEVLLAGPAAADLRACPAARRALAPLRRMLGLPPAPRAPRRPASAAPATAPASAPAGPPLASPPRPDPIPPHRSIDPPPKARRRPWWVPLPRRRSG